MSPPVITIQQWLQMPYLDSSDLNNNSQLSYQSLSQTGTYHLVPSPTYLENNK